MSTPDNAPAGPSILRLSLAGLGLRAGQSLAALLNVIVVARALGPEGRGEYYVFLATLAVATRVVDLGTSVSVVVFAGRGRHSPAIVHGTAVRLAAVQWTGASILIAVVAAVLGRTGTWSPPWLALAMTVALLPLALYEQVWNQLSVGLRLIVPMNALHAAGALVLLVGNLALVLSQRMSVETALGLYGAVLVLKVLAMRVLMAPRLRRGDAKRPPPGIAREMLRFGMRSYPNNVAVLLWTRVPTFVLLAFQGPAVVGLFSVAQQLLEQLALPVQAVQDAAYRQVAQALPGVAAAHMNRILRPAVWSVALLALLAALLAPLAIPALFGAAFIPSAALLQVLLVGLVASVVPVLLSPFFFTQLDRPGLVSWLAWARVCSSLLLCLLLVPVLAATGAAIALVVSEVAASVLTIYLYLRFTGSHVADLFAVRPADLRPLARIARRAGWARR
ncbi:MAG: oligosaccharide flippase family protein [Chloroflexi bacterium]|nr:oligosaccharide flippase family protein [Chloroflexota bacterium]